MAEMGILEQFYRDNFPPEVVHRFLSSSHTGHFNVFPRGVYCKQLTNFNRLDYYKISLIEGTGRIHYTDRVVEVTGKALAFYNPAVPYTWESLCEEQKGYFCLFNNEFIAPSLSDDSFRHSPLFDASLPTVYNLSDEQFEELSTVFRRMAREVESDYVKKYDVLRHYLHIIFHEADKMQPANMVSGKHVKASVRLSSLFMEMLERQFPVDSTEHALSLKTPADFAAKLSIHVNHLNRAVRKATGKSTTEIISTRVANEAKSLLKYTDNSIADIAYSLGFEHPSNFNTFFRKHVGHTPGAERAVTESLANAKVVL